VFHHVVLPVTLIRRFLRIGGIFLIVVFLRVRIRVLDGVPRTRRPGVVRPRYLGLTVYGEQRALPRMILMPPGVRSDRLIPLPPPAWRWVEVVELRCRPGLSASEETHTVLLGENGRRPQDPGPLIRLLIPRRGGVPGLRDRPGSASDQGEDDPQDHRRYEHATQYDEHHARSRACCVEGKGHGRHDDVIGTRMTPME
jgi:hypothetical protein